MLVWMGIDVFDLVAWLLVTSFVMGLWGGLLISMEGTKGVGIGVLFLLVHFFQMSMLTRKTARAIPIMAM
jgi:hypothetical protein